MRIGTLKTYLAGAVLSLLALSTASVFAQNYSGNCAGLSSWNGQGSATVSDSTCTISSAVSATGSITVTASGSITAQSLTSGGGDIVLSAGGNISTGPISSNASFGATTTGGTIEIPGAINSNQGGNGGNILLQASGNIGLGTISTNGGTSTGAVEIDPNEGNATSTPFTIGTAGANGVVSVNTSNTTAGGTNGIQFTGGLFVVNGSASATGGINITSASAINVSASQSRSGGIFLYAQMGSITLPSGSVNADAGATGQGAGDIEFYANQINTVAGTIVSASQDPTAYNTDHPVAFITTTLNVGGATQLLANGNGYSSGQPGWVIIAPPGGCVRSSNHSLDNLLWANNNCNGIFTTKLPLTISGSGTLLASSNGFTTAIDIGGYPIKIGNGAVTLQAEGSVNHNITIGYQGTYSNTNALTMNGTGAVLLNASGVNSGDSGGQIRVLTDSASITAPSLAMHADGVGTGSGGYIDFQPTAVTSLSSATATFTTNGVGGQITFEPVYNSANGPVTITSTTLTLTANAPTSGGNAGSIYFQTGSLSLGASTKTSMTANGPTSGAGNGGYIDLSPGTISTLKLGTKAGDIQMLANGGSTSGNGGTIFTNPLGSVTIDTASAVSATVPGTTGTGGTVSLYGYPNFAVTSGITGATINVDGKGTGSGGAITLQGNGTLTLGTAAGGLSLSASGETGTGNGGTIDINNLTTVAIDSSLDVSGGTSSGSTANGGTVNIAAETITLADSSESISANGAGTGNGGSITLNTTGSTPLSIPAGVELFAEGGNNSMTNGGSVTLTNVSTEPITLDNQIDDQPDGESFGDDIVKLSKAAAISPRAVSFTATGTVTTLNGISCKQKMVAGGSNPQPYVFWDCFDGPNVNLPATLIANMSTSKINGTVLQALFPKGNQNGLAVSTTLLYVFSDPQQYDTYFGGLNTPLAPGQANYVPPGSGGYTVGGSNNGGVYLVYMNIFQNAFSTLQLQENTAHELGHVLDLYSAGHNTYSTTYNTKYMTDDQTDLTNDTGTGLYDKGGAKNSPCTKTNGNQAPFDGQTGRTGSVYDDSTNTQVCNETSGAVTIQSPPNTNLALAQDVSPGIIGSGTSYNPNGAPAYLEIFAEAFAWAVYTQGASNPFVYNAPYQEAADGLFANGYYACAVAYAQSAATNTTINPPTGHCK